MSDYGPGQDFSPRQIGHSGQSVLEDSLPTMTDLPVKYGFFSAQFVWRNDEACHSMNQQTTKNMSQNTVPQSRVGR